jgi:hypothetical protein
MTPEDFAQRAVLNLPGEQNVVLSPALILLIADILSGLIPIIRDRCRKSSEEVSHMASDPRPLERIALRRRIRREMGIREYRKNGYAVTDAILKTGAEATVEEVAALLESV